MGDLYPAAKLSRRGLEISNMEYRQLGRTNLRVSAICLGTMTWGEQNSEAEGHSQLDLALDRGVNFIDAAEIYPVPVNTETQGRTEKIIGSWLEARKNRDKVIIATKVAGRSARLSWLRDDANPPRLSSSQIKEAVDKSLKRLRTDYIDLYQTHWPDRPMRLFGGHGYGHEEGDAHPIDETLEALTTLVRSGKVRHIGVSNETPWGVMQYLNGASDTGLGRIVSIQNAYNLLNRVYEFGLSEFAFREQVGLLAYSPLGQGFLSGKYVGGARPEGSRLVLFPNFPTRYQTQTAEDAISKYVRMAKKHGLDPAQMALQFVTTRPFVTSNIIGATTLEQLESNLASTDVTLSSDVLDDIEKIHLQNPNPCP